MLTNNNQPIVNVYRAILSLYFPSLTDLKIEFTSGGIDFDNNSWFISVIINNISSGDRYSLSKTSLVDLDTTPIFTHDTDTLNQVNPQYKIPFGSYYIEGVYLNYLDGSDWYVENGSSDYSSGTTGNGILLGDCGMGGKFIVHSPSMNLNDKSMAFMSPY
jgi:hypothetical protein